VLYGGQSGKSQGVFKRREKQKKNKGKTAIFTQN